MSNANHHDPQSSRRGFLKLGAALAAGSTVAACAGSPRSSGPSTERYSRMWRMGLS